MSDISVQSPESLANPACCTAWPQHIGSNVGSQWSPHQHDLDLFADPSADVLLCEDFATLNLAASPPIQAVTPCHQGNAPIVVQFGTACSSPGSQLFKLYDYSLTVWPPPWMDESCEFFQGPIACWNNPRCSAPPPQSLWSGAQDHQGKWRPAQRGRKG